MAISALDKSLSRAERHKVTTAAIGNENERPEYGQRKRDRVKGHRPAASHMEAGKL